jgi:serine/threonine protein kinase
VPELRLENSIVDDRYHVDRCLGRGSYAEIFLAHDARHDDRPVIIKALNTSLQGTLDLELEQTLIENFQNEAIALDKVRHPHIIRRLGHGTAADLMGVAFHYLVLEYMPGGDLLGLCRREPLTLDDALFYFKQVAEALAYAHSQKVIHRDIKPNNILLSADKKVVKIADFGVAKMTLDDVIEITRVGTNVYAPPEHHPDAAEGVVEKLTPSADIYSLAKTIYTALTARAPRQFSRLPITGLPPELEGEKWADGLLRVLRKATAPRAADRYNSVEEFWGDFARVKSGAEDGGEADAEATRVRSRLAGAAAVERAAARPNFQSLTSAPLEGVRPQKARIVVDLPRRQPPDQKVAELQGRKDINIKTRPLGSTASDSDRDPLDVVNAAGAAKNGGLRARLARRAQLARAEVAGGQAINEKDPAAFRTRPMREGDELERGLLEDLRAVINSEWLRRIFIVFLVAALIGLAASTYYHFAGRGPLLGGSQHNAKIAGALNVNMRSEPGGEVVAALPVGTSVRVLEYRGAWVRIKVVDWPGNSPDNAPDTGWVDGRYVRLD